MAKLPTTMRAWQYSSTSPSLEANLKINPAAPIPTPKENQHLIRVLAAALNPVDYKPAELPIVGRFIVSKPATPCVDFAGVLVTPAAGSSLKAGQLVFGASGSNPLAGGALADYMLGGIESTAALPEGVDPLHAAGIAVAGLTGYQSIVPRVKKGDRVFINGGSGGTGVFAVQIAKAVGCHVTTTCSTVNIKLCESLGADEVVDYKQGSVIDALVKKGVKFDHVVDNVGTDKVLVWRAHEVMEKGAAYVLVGHGLTVASVVDGVKRKLLPSFLGGYKGTLEGFWPKPTVEDLDQLGAWMKEGKVKAVIDQKFSFEDAPKAFQRLKTGRAKGKIVVDVASETYKEV